MKNEHLVPIVVQDIVNKLSDITIRENERMVLIQRLEAIRDYCDIVIKKQNTNKR